MLNQVGIFQKLLMRWTAGSGLPHLCITYHCAICRMNIVWICSCSSWRKCHGRRIDFAVWKWLYFVRAVLCWCRPLIEVLIFNAPWERVRIWNGTISCCIAWQYVSNLWPVLGRWYWPDAHSIWPFGIGHPRPYWYTILKTYTLCGVKTTPILHPCVKLHLLSFYAFYSVKLCLLYCEIVLQW